MKYFYKIMSLGISFISLYILRKNLDANEFGQLIFTTTIAITFATFSSLGADNLFAKMMALPNFSKNLEKAGQNLFIGVFLITCFVSPIYIYSYSVAQDLFFVQFFTICVAIYRVLGGVSVYIKRLGLYYFFSVYGPLLILALLSFSINESQQLLFFTSAIMLAALYLRPLRLVKFTWASQVFQTKNLFSVARTGAPIVLITFFVGNLDVLDLKFVNIIFGDAAAGDIALVNRLANLVLIALAAWNIPAIMEFQNFAISGSRKEFWKRYKSITFGIVKVTIPVTFLLLVLRQQIFDFFVIPVSYTVPFWILTSAKVFAVLVGPTGVALIQLGFKWHFVVLSFFVLLFKFCMLYFMNLSGVLVHYGIAGLVCVSAFATVLLNLIGLVVLAKGYNSKC